MCYIVDMSSRVKKKEIKIEVSDSNPLECHIVCDWFEPEIGSYCSLYDSDLVVIARDLTRPSMKIARCADCIKEFGGVEQ